MKILILVGAVVIVGLAALYITQTAPEVDNASNTNANSQTQTDAESVMNEDGHGDDDQEHDENGLHIEGEVGAETSLGLEAGDGPSFDVKGVNFEFDVKEIRVKEGDTVTINFSSTEGFHDLVIDEFNAATAQVRPGTPTSVTFVADKAGTYEYYCSVGSHRAQGMVGTLIVE